MYFSKKTLLALNVVCETQGQGSIQSKFHRIYWIYLNTYEWTKEAQVDIQIQRDSILFSLSKLCYHREMLGRGKSRMQDFVYHPVFTVSMCIYFCSRVPYVCVTRIQCLQTSHESQKMILKNSLCISKMLGNEN